MARIGTREYDHELVQVALRLYLRICAELAMKERRQSNHVPLKRSCVHDLIVFFVEILAYGIHIYNEFLSKLLDFKVALGDFSRRSSLEWQTELFPFTQTTVQHEDIVMTKGLKKESKAQDD
jgi:hypothetical protein